MSEDNQLLDTPTSEFMVTVQDGDIANWDDTKKSEFVGLFHNRVRAARYILERTAFRVAETAESRKFISQKHLRKLYDNADLYGQRLNFNPHRFTDPTGEGNRWHHSGMVGGRELTALDDIADQRAKAVLNELPPLKAAVQIIDPETAKLLERKEKLLELGDKIRDEVETVSEPIIMADLDQNMTIGAFRKLVSDQDKKRKQLLSKLTEIGKEGSSLEATIAKRLYAGLPGLSEAVVEVIKSHIDRSTALDEVSRRVDEQVRFGDSEAATSLLNHFEQDEAEIGDKVKSQLVEAMEKLKLSVRGAKKKKVVKKALKA
jgi:hypothetical protein